jgi:hypothetical protein
MTRAARESRSAGALATRAAPRLIFLLFPAIGAANTSNVFSPDVSGGSSAVEYRLSYIPEDGALPDLVSHRLHYQRALSDSWRARILAAHASVGGGSLDYQYTRVELQWQYLENRVSGGTAALRFEVQIGDESPDRLRLAWSGKIDVDAWQLRANALIGRQIGSGAAGGLQLETRAQLVRRMRHGLSVGIEMFNDFNTTAEFGSLDDQRHQLGPVLKADFGRGWSLLASYLAALSGAAPDHDLRLMVARDF